MTKLCSRDGKPCCPYCKPGICFHNSPARPHRAAFASPVTPAAAVDREAIAGAVHREMFRPSCHGAALDDICALGPRSVDYAAADAILALTPAAATIPEGMVVRFTVTVQDDGHTSLHTEAKGATDAYLTIDKAIGAMLAERVDMRNCPAHPSPPAPPPCPFCGDTQPWPDKNFNGKVWTTCSNRNCGANAPEEMWPQRAASPIPPATIPGGDREAVDRLLGAIDAANEEGGHRLWKEVEDAATSLRAALTSTGEASDEVLAEAGGACDCAARFYGDDPNAHQLCCATFAANPVPVDAGGVIVPRELLSDFVDAAESLDDKHRDSSDIWEAAAAMSISAGTVRKLAALAAHAAPEADHIGGVWMPAPEAGEPVPVDAGGSEIGRLANVLIEAWEQCGEVPFPLYDKEAKAMVRAVLAAAHTAPVAGSSDNG